MQYTYAYTYAYTYIRRCQLSDEELYRCNPPPFDILDRTDPLAT